MPKTNRQITLDFDINEKLKLVNNASELINEMLINHFKSIQTANTAEREIQLAKELESVSRQFSIIQEEYNKVKKQLDEKRLKDLELESQEDKKWVDQKRKAEIRKQAQDKFNIEVKLGNIEPGIDSWEKFYSGYIYNHNEKEVPQ